MLQQTQVKTVIPYFEKFTKKIKTLNEIKKLPGIGEYTGNILLALIYNQPRIALDGNVKRVFSRILNKHEKKIDYDKILQKNKKKIILFE